VNYSSDDDGNPFLGRDFSMGRRDYSEHMAIKIDDEVRRLILDAETRARDILSSKREILDSIAAALLDRETIDGEELAALHEGKPMPHREKVVVPTWADKERNAKDKRRGPSIFGPPKPAAG
jgi:cell division protease FtsH